jgi:AsmA protein
MASDLGTPADVTSNGPQKQRSLGWRIFRLVLIGTVVSVALLLIFPPTGIIKDQLAKSIGTSIKRTVTIGAMRINYWSYWPKLNVEFDDVAVSNPEGMAARDVFRAETVKARM